MQVSLGDSRWLDGLSGEVTTGLVACLALADSSIQIVTWDTRQEQVQHTTVYHRQSYSLHRSQPGVPLLASTASL